MASFESRRGDELREHLYVDVARVRSLLSQLENGLLEHVSEDSGAQESWTTPEDGLTSFPVDRTSMRGRNEVRALDELHLEKFEVAALEAGFLAEFPDRLKEPRTWTNGEVEEFVTEHPIIRINAPARITDAHYFTKVIQAFGSSSLITSMDPEAKKIAGQIGEIFRLIYGVGITLRVLPCGVGYDDFGFQGTLLERTGYIEQERTALFGRYGAEPREWTVVGLIERIGQRDAATPNSNPLQELQQGRSIDRSQLEKVIGYIMDTLEKSGMTEAPRWPSVAITPIAVYRSLRPANMQ